MAGERRAGEAWVHHGGINVRGDPRSGWRHNISNFLFVQALGHLYWVGAWRGIEVAISRVWLGRRLGLSDCLYTPLSKMTHCLDRPNSIALLARMGLWRLAGLGWAGLVVALLMLGGCQGAGSRNDVSAPSLPYPELDDRPRALVFNAPALRELGGENERRSWYASRNDERPTTFAGFHRVRGERRVTLTYDRQTTVAGRVRDHYSSTSRTRRVSETTY